MALIVLAIPFILLAILNLAALRWGVDSRDGSTDPRAPRRPVGLQTR